MTNTEITKYVKTLLKRERLRDALDALETYSKDIDDQTENTIILQKGQLFVLRQKEANRSISNEELSVQLNSLKYRINMVLNQLDPTGNHVEQIELKKEIITRPKEHATPKTILFLSASPTNAGVLRLNEELREIKKGLVSSIERENFILKSEAAVQVSDIRRSVSSIKPEFIHFAGHGKTNSLVVEGKDGRAQELPEEGLTMLFDYAKDSLECIMLNACNSRNQAETYSNVGTGIYVIGMSGSMGDRPAIDFSVAFYESIGDGKTITEAFRLAKIDLSIHPDYIHIPELWYQGQKV